MGRIQNAHYLMSVWRVSRFVLRAHGLRWLRRDYVYADAAAENVWFSPEAVS